MGRRDGEPLTPFKAVVLDLDGTLYVGDEAIPGAPAAVDCLRAQGLSVIFLTNNPRHTPTMYLRKLRRLGFTAFRREIVTSVEITLQLLRTLDIRAESGILVVGERRLKTALQRAGYRLCSNRRAAVVLVSFDTGLRYPVLQEAYLALRRGALFLATNPDRVCPTPEGGLLDAGVLIRALEEASGRPVERVAGKPSATAADYVLRLLGVSPADVVMVGDRAETDVAFGRAAGMFTVLVETGATGSGRLPDELRPDARITSVGALPAVLRAITGSHADRAGPPP